MATFVIPLADTPIQTLQVELEGELYTLTLSYNTRLAAWVCCIKDVDDVVLISGAVLDIRYPLLQGFVAPGLPPGEFYVVDPAGAQKTRPGRTAWRTDGEDLRFVYVESEA